MDWFVYGGIGFGAGVIVTMMMAWGIWHRSFARWQWLRGCDSCRLNLKISGKAGEGGG